MISLDERIERILTALTFAEQRLGQPLPIKDLARQCGWCERAFHRHFVDLADVSPLDYLRKRRLTLASDALLNSHWTITQIAESIGFSTVEAFYKAFVQRFQTSPSHYRSNAKELWQYRVPSLDAEHLYHVNGGRFSKNPEHFTASAQGILGFRKTLPYDRLLAALIEARQKLPMLTEIYAYGRTNPELISQKSADYILGILASDPYDPQAQALLGGYSSVAEFLPLDDLEFQMFRNCGDASDFAKSSYYIWNQWLPRQNSDLNPTSSLIRIEFAPWPSHEIMDQDFFLPWTPQELSTAK